MAHVSIVDVVAFLREQRYGVVSSIADDGSPQSAVVGIGVGDDCEIVFDTLGTSRKAQNLRRDPRASLVVWAGERTVQLEGVVDEPTGIVEIGHGATSNVTGQ
jgi:PPOX class probable F420-dependent enzyme